MCVKTAQPVVKSVDPDQIWHSVASDFGLHCLLRPGHPNNYLWYFGFLKAGNR